MVRPVRPLEILYVTLGYKPAYRVGGPITSVAAVAEGLVQAGHRVTVYTTNSNLDDVLDVPTNRPTVIRGVEVHYFTFEEPIRRRLQSIGLAGNSSRYLYSPAMKRALRESIAGFDLVHTHLPFVYPTWLAGRLARSWNVPLFYHQRGVFDRSRLNYRSVKKRIYLELMEKPVLRSANTLFALTSQEVESYRMLGATAPHVIVPNGIDADEYVRSATASRFAEWGISSTDLVVLFMGRLHPTKGPERLFNAFAELAQRVPRSKLVLAGPDEHAMAETLRAKAAALNLTQRVIIPGMVHGRMKCDLLARSDLFVLPSDAEGFSIAVLEAMASETAVLISPGCHFDAVQKAGAGRIVPNRSDEIAQAMFEMFADLPALRQMGRNARSLVLRDFTWASAVDATIAAYQAGLERQQRSVSLSSSN